MNASEVVVESNLAVHAVVFGRALIRNLVEVVADILAMYRHPTVGLETHKVSKSMREKGQRIHTVLQR